MATKGIKEWAFAVLWKKPRRTSKDIGDIIMSQMLCFIGAGASLLGVQSWAWCAGLR